MTRDRDEILHADKIVLPGVGAFGDAMDKLHKFNLVNTIYDGSGSKDPFPGGYVWDCSLCFSESEESPGVAGLGLLKGKIKRIPDRGLKIPHMGWNSIEITPGARLFKGIGQEPYVYFVHSYYLEAENIEDVAAKTYYGVEIHASVEHETPVCLPISPGKKQ